MKKLLLLILSVFIIDLSAQVEPVTNIKGVRPTTSNKQIEVGTTRAVIVGVSDYQSEEIPDLKYAHKDAAAFKTYLQSSAGGKITEENIELLVNEEATTAKIVAALDWLISKSKKGDKAIIYFSGHGDVETKTAMQMGFLLTHDSPPNVYMAGAYPIFYLQSIVATMSGNDIQVVLITDACRAGKLAGSANDGVQATTSALSQQFANEVKILSCQPDEFSLEGEQWGGGRGCFSYHLIEGLIGLADNNSDATVNLLEIGRYLEDNVSAEAEPQSQIPFTTGKKNTKLFQVNEKSLASLKKQKLYNTPQMASISTKGKSSQLDGDIPLEEQGLVHSFLEKLNQNQLLTPKDDCAEYYYHQIINTPSLQVYHSQLKRNYAVKLQEEAQQYINLMLKGDTQLIDDYVYNKNKQLDYFPDYLARAAALLGTEHYMYGNLKQKEYFFRGVVLKEQLKRTKVNPKETKQIQQEAFVNYQKAIRFDSTASYVHLALANSYLEMADQEKSLNHINKAISLSPSWALALATKGYILSNFNKSDKAIAYYKEALQLDPKQIYITQWLVNEYRANNQTEEVKYWSEQQINTIELALKENGTLADFSKGLLAMAYSEVGNHTKAEQIFKQIFEDPTKQDAVLLQARALNYYWMDQIEKAEKILEKSVAINPNAASQTLMGLFHIRQERYRKAKKALKRAIELDPKYAYAYYVRGQLYEKKKKRSKAESNYQLAFTASPYNQRYYQQLLDWYKSQGYGEKELDIYFEKMNTINKDYPPILKGFAMLYNHIGSKPKARALLKKALTTKKPPITP